MIPRGYRIWKSWAPAFWDRVDVRPQDECWLWKGPIDTGGYGAVSINTLKRNTHRVAYELTYGPPLPGFWIIHTCDVRLCCNPLHLKADTPYGNVFDMDRKGRRGYAYGEKAGAAKLTEYEVTEIRLLYLTGKYSPRELGYRYGVYKQTIGKILRGDRWGHVPFPTEDYLTRVELIARVNRPTLAAKKGAA